MTDDLHRNDEKRADHRPVVTVISDGNPPDWPWITNHFGDALRWRFHGLPRPRGGIRPRIARLAATIRAVRAARDHAVIVSHAPLAAALVEVARKLLRVRTPHITYSFNYAALPTGFSRRRAAALFAGIDRFVVSSAMEAGLYADWFGLSRDRFDFVLWGVNAPLADTVAVSERPYVCAIGGNARDYPLLMAAAARLPDIPFLCVVRPDNLAGLDVPANVEFRTNRPLGETMAVLRDARAMVLPLIGDRIPCGHVTLVAAFYLGTPVIATDSAGVSDYVRDGETGVLVPAGSAEALAGAIRALWDDRARGDELAAKAQAFAESECAEPNYVRHFRGELARLGIG